MRPVTDPALLAALEGDNTAPPQWRPVTDPALLAELNVGMDLDPTAGNSFLQNAAIGAGKAVTDVGRGLRQLFRVGDQDDLTTDVAESRKRDAPLMETAGGTTGNIAAQLSTALIPGAAGLRGATLIGAGTGATQPTVEGESRIGNIATGAAFGAGGQQVGARVTNAVTNRLAERATARATAQAVNATRDAAIAAGKAEGLVVPPTMINPSKVNQALEALSGKIKTEQAASLKNAPILSRMVGKALGLAPDEPVNAAALARIRGQAGQAYEAMRQTGAVQADQTLAQALNKITAQYQGAGRSFPGLAKNDVVELIDGLRVPQFDASDAVDAIRVLRESAETAFGSRNNALGKAAREAAKAIEDQLGRHLQATGAPGQLLKDYTEARTLIAKTYDVQKALGGGDTLNAAKLAEALRRGRPLTGELRTVAEFAGKVPKAVQPVERVGSVTGPSVLDAAFAASQGGGTGLAWLTGRPAARATILSGPYQARMTTPDYSAPIRDRAAEQIAIRDRLTRALGALSAPGYFAATRD